VFLDFDLPDGNAFAVLEAFEARGEQVPAIIITGHREDALAERAVRVGARIVAKPVDAKQIRAFLDGLRSPSQREFAAALPSA
jgi:DNA-binding NtrC family response regulator